MIEYLLIYAFSFVGVPYVYGGNDPLSGFDCSGYVVELLKSAGVVRYNVDLSAENLYNLLNTPRLGSVLTHPQAGAICFYGDKTQIRHVGFCVSDKLMLEAGGGNETTLSKDDARVAQAFVKLRPIGYRKDFFVAILPAYP